MTVNNIFEFFPNDNSENEIEKAWEEYLNIPEAKLGMFVKLIQNNVVFNEKLKFFFEKIQQNFDEEATRKASEQTIFTKAWGYIKDIDLNDDEHLYALLKPETEDLLNALIRAITFFEKKEEYEKCGFLFEIKKIVEKI